jgi:hypothetical protein
LYISPLKAIQHRAVLVAERLVARGDIDDGETPEGESHARFEVEALVVGAAMTQCGGSALEPVTLGRQTLRVVERREPAHRG